MELDQVVPLDGDAVEMYRVFWPPDPNLVQSRRGLALVVLVCWPAGGGVPSCASFCTCSRRISSLRAHRAWDNWPSHQDGSARRPHFRGRVEELGVDLDVQLVDVGVQALSAITPLAFVPDTDETGIISFGEGLDIILDPQLLMQYAKEWIGQQAKAPKKKATTAVLAEQMSTLMTMIPTISQQLVGLQQDHKQMKPTIEQQKTAPPVRASQLPVSGQLAGFAQMMGSLPRTKPLPTTPAPVLALQTSGPDANLSLQQQAEEGQSIAGRSLCSSYVGAKPCVAHNMQQGSDPLLDGQAASSASSLSTRGWVPRSRAAAKGISAEVRVIVSCCAAKCCEASEAGSPET